tara:strand:+ start:4100 stop:4741 length:642 start_codon:yes stop_codon:yes gene_type:complete
MSEEQIVDSTVTETPTDSASVEQTISETSQDATASETAGEASDSEPNIPKSRFDEINTQLKDARTKLAEYEDVNTNDLLNVRNESKAETEKISLDEKTLREVNSLKEKFEINEVKAKYPDMEKYAKDMAEFVRGNPTASWESAYKNAKFDEIAQTAKQAGREEAYQNIGEKPLASGESPNVHKPISNNLSKAEAMLLDRTASLADVEAMLPRG